MRHNTFATTATFKIDFGALGLHIKSEVRSFFLFSSFACDSRDQKALL
jgi:hypothetical protein